MRHADTAIVQVYAAATYGWRGYFAVHPWIIYKRAGDTTYTRYDVIGWGSRPVVRRNYAVPDGLWFGVGLHGLLRSDGGDRRSVPLDLRDRLGRAPHGHRGVGDGRAYVFDWR